MLVNCLILLGFYGLYQGSADSARYFFSTLAQSQASIVAIVITLTLVAVQLSSQTYTPRVMDLFLKSKMFWSLLSFYGISIIYDVAVLAMIPPIPSDKSLSEPILVFGSAVTFNTFILIGLILTIGTFSILFPFILNVIIQLKPEKILEGIIKATNINEIKAAAEGKIIDDPLLPIKEIGKKALSSGDDATVLKVITELSTVAGKLIEGRDFAKRKTYREILKTSLILSEVKVKEDRQARDSDNDVISYFTSYLSDLTERSLECKSILVFNNIAISLGNIGISLTKKKAKVVINVLGKLKEMEKLVLEKRLENDTCVPIEYFRMVSVEAANNQHWEAVEYSIGVLGLFVSKYEYSEQNVQIYDEDIIYGVIGVFQHPYLIVESIDEIGIAIVKAMPNIDGRDSVDFEEYFDGLIEIDRAVKHLNKMAEIAIKREWWGWESTMKETVRAITIICGSLIDKGGENLHHPINPTTLMAKSLEKITTSSTHSEVYYETKNILTILEMQAEYLANKTSKNVSIVVDSLIEIYKFIYLNHCKGNPCDMMLGAPASLGMIGKLTMINDIKFLGDEEFKKIKEKGFISPENFKPTTQKIVDAIIEMGIGASNNNYPNSSWIYVAEDAVRYIIFFSTYYIRNENKEICKYLVLKLKNMNGVYKDKFGDLITEIVLENEKGKTFGTSKYFIDEKGFSKSKELKMDDDDFKAFLIFKELFEKR